MFLLDVFKCFNDKYQNSVLLIVGDGEEHKSIEKKATELGLFDKVIITGVRRDANKFYSAMDCFVLPSLKEGFPLTLVEAQASKLPCLISDTVTDSSKINENVSFLSLKQKPELWADEIDKLIHTDRNIVSDEKLKKEFSIEACTKKLETIYDS